MANGKEQPGPCQMLSRVALAGLQARSPGTVLDILGALKTATKRAQAKKCLLLL